MSRVYFHTEHREAELRGSERGWLDLFAPARPLREWGVVHSAARRCTPIE